MATFSATDLVTKPRPMGGYGNSNVVWGSVTPTAGTSASVYRPVIIPAGMTVTGIQIDNADLDSNASPTAVYKIGYTPVNASDGPTAVDNYFGTGITGLQAAGRTTLSFAPIKFEYDVYLDLTLTTGAATFASGRVTAIVTGEATGIA